MEQRYARCSVRKLIHPVSHWDFIELLYLERTGRKTEIEERKVYWTVALAEIYLSCL